MTEDQARALVAKTSNPKLGEALRAYARKTSYPPERYASTQDLEDWYFEKGRDIISLAEEVGRIG